jgi:cell division septum initiation protein DivIVA
MLKELQRRAEEVAVVKAKLFLDQVQISLKVVADYPDMVEENKELLQSIDEQEKTIKMQAQVKESLERQINLLN